MKTKNLPLSLLMLILLIQHNPLTAQSVGIGTLVPAEKLDVIGNIKADTVKSSSLKIVTNAGLGKVLTSDGAGNATWQYSGGAFNAVNGLHKKSDSIILGGIITEPTRFRINANSLTFKDAGIISVQTIAQTGITSTATLSSTPLLQTFTATSDGNLTALRLYIAAFGGSSITAAIKNATNITIGSATNIYGSIINDWDSFNFSTALLTSGEVYTIEITSTGITQIHYENTNPYAGGVSSIGAMADIAFRVFVSAETNLLHLSGNRIGINTLTPAASLDINGTFKMADGSQGLGKLLVSDADGKGGWQNIQATNYGGWGTAGNMGTTSSSFIGTTDNQPLVIKTNGFQSGKIDHTNRNYSLGQHAGSGITTATGQVAIGHAALQVNQTGLGNTAIGDSVLSAAATAASFNTGIGAKALAKNTIGEVNTAVGVQALYNSVTGSNNTALGAYTLYKNISGGSNVAVGERALYNNTTGNYNIAIGSGSYANTTGQENVAIGYASLSVNTSGSRNIAIGYGALFANATSNNVAVGHSSLYSNTTGLSNTAVGSSSLFSNNIGHTNTAVGDQTMFRNTSGVNNVAMGGNALFENRSGYSNVAIGVNSLEANQTGNGNVAIGFRTLKYNLNSNNVAVGYMAGTDALMTDGCTFLGAEAGADFFDIIQNASAIGFRATVSQSNSMVLGNNFVTKWGFGINPGAANIIEFANTSARLTTGGVWTNASDRNLKTNIIPVDSRQILEKIMALPVSRWNYKNEDASISHIGPMAQDFYRLFQTGGDDKTISSIDPSGVAFVGIQQLKKEIDALKRVLAAQQQLIEQLLRR